MALRDEHKRPWIELEIVCPEPLVDVVSDFLISTLHRGVLIEDLPESFAQSEPMSLLKAYMTKDEAEKGLFEEIEFYLSDLSSMESDYPDIKLNTKAVIEEDWTEGWKRYFKPIKVGRRLVIKPSWEEYVPKASEIVIEIDPGQAFGTGTHPTTIMMLEALEQILEKMVSQNLPKGVDVLDVGTGTGILGIAAAKLGAASVIGIDVDPVAVEVARKNIYGNHVHKQMSVSTTPLWQIEGGFHLVLANLDKNTLELLAEDLVSKMADEAVLLISGILEGQEKGVIAIFDELGLKNNMLNSQSENGNNWLCLAFEHETNV